MGVCCSRSSCQSCKSRVAPKQAPRLGVGKLVCLCRLQATSGPSAFLIRPVRHWQICQNHVMIMTALIRTFPLKPCIPLGRSFTLYPSTLITCRCHCNVSSVSLHTFQRNSFEQGGSMGSHKDCNIDNTWSFLLVSPKMQVFKVYASLKCEFMQLFKKKTADIIVYNNI